SEATADPSSAVTSTDSVRLARALKRKKSAFPFPLKVPAQSPEAGSAAGAAKDVGSNQSGVWSALDCIRMSCWKSPPLLNVTINGWKMPEGATCHGPYGPPIWDHKGPSDSTLNWYWALLAAFGISNPARSKKPSSSVSSEPKRSKACPVLSLNPV